MTMNVCMQVEICMKFNRDLSLFFKYHNYANIILSILCIFLYVCYLEYIRNDTYKFVSNIFIYEKLYSIHCNFSLHNKKLQYKTHI